MKIIASLIFGLFLASATSAYGQVWREIKPIESTVDDVKRLLGGKVTCLPGGCEYKIPKGGTLYIDFSSFTCKEAGPGTYWNVPLYTVISLRAHNPNLSVSDLNIDESELTLEPPSDQLNDTYIYERRELGMKVLVETDERTVSLLEYYPAAKYDKILCPSSSKSKTKPPARRK